MVFQSTFLDALDKSLEVREVCGLDFKSPADVYQICDRLGLAVRLTNDVSMEGVYVGTGLNKPTIILSTLRPLARRTFTCAHELGHHIFGDGIVVDEISDESRTGRDRREIRANAFAGHFLMPVLGVAEAFTARGWRPENAEPKQVFTIACNFGVGYTTLIHHMRFALRLISERHERSLLRTSLPEIRRELLGASLAATLVVADERFGSPTLDVEVGSLILLPFGSKSDSVQLQAVGELAAGCLFKPLKQGIYRAYGAKSDWAVLVRVSRHRYYGLARYRHLEDVDDEDELP